jgi:hypothetical protein
LICGKLLMPLGRHLEGVPADQNRPRPLRVVEGAAAFFCCTFDPRGNPPSIFRRLVPTLVGA